MRLQDIAATLNLPCPLDVALSRVSIDSRQVKPGDLFIAIRGEQLDGHQFIAEAAEKGASAFILSEKNKATSVPQLLVQDTIKALGAIATAHRQTLTCDVVAVTGSNGKTTTKEMVAAILPQRSYATKGNLNNHIGVPLCVLELEPSHRFAVIELGASHLKEIAYTVAIAKPKVSVITNIAPAHIEGFGSIEGVAKAKGEIYEGLVPHGIAVINDDDHYAHFWDSSLIDKRVVRFSITKPTEIHATEVCFDKEGCGQFKLVTPIGEELVQLQVAGSHNISNALAAAACTYALGIPLPEIAAGLAAFSGVKGRMTFLKGKNDSLVIDDTYNANLKSSLTALDVLSKREGRRIFVFGDMAELGVFSNEHHQTVGETARNLGIDLLMTCGKQSETTAKAYGGKGRHYENQADLLHDLVGLLDKTTTVLVKGSRSSAMEKIVQQLQA